MKKLKLFLTLLLISLTSILYSQYDPMFGSHCYEDLDNYRISGEESPSSQNGRYKPERTNYYSGTSSTSVFRVLIVFFEYYNDTVDVNNPNWASGEPPSYMNDLLALDRNNATDWWDAYDENEERLSDYWMEASRGNLHFVGEARHIILDEPWYWYKDNGNLAAVYSEIYAKLDNDPYLIWSDFDNWTYENGTYVYQPDGQIDMIYMVHRTWRPGMTVTPGSIAVLDSSLQGRRHVLASGDTIVAGYGFSGSGCTYTPGAGAYNTPNPILNSPINQDGFLPLQAHELGHYHFGSCHARYGIMTGGGCGLFTGLDSWHSPWEAIRLGYGEHTIVDYAESTQYYLDDYSSRNMNGSLQVLEVPIGSNEFFLIANRMQESSWDRIMAGDTAHDNAFRDINPEYGKGVYIYHTPSGYNWYPQMDMELADGLFNWTQVGYQTPDWSNSQQIEYYQKTGVSYANDQSTGGTSSKDDKSIVTWFGIGKRHVNLGEDGTDRLYTNLKETWTSRAWKGDRWDSWKPGYNEVFSPYSSPSTNTWNNSYSGIFIWIKSYYGNTAEIEIYRDKDANGETLLEEILEATPPSRPMGLKIEEHYPIDSTFCRPMLIWNHNREPDMWRGQSNDQKRYRIFKAKRHSMSYIPYNYSLVAEVDLVDNEEDPAFWIDYSEKLYDCSQWDQPPYGEPAPVRYKIQAVDNGSDNNMRYSVLSDFASDVVILNGGPQKDGPNLTGMEGETLTTPKSFNLHQNYPNPFNPVTNLQYDIPDDVFVSIKVYDITGREIATLINEFKVAGFYITSFDGSSLSSGVYYYKIQAGSFEAVKKMILLK
jgi:hypothetical protein